MTRAPRDTATLRDELARQSDLLNRERPVRFAAMTLAFAILATFLPLWLVALSIAVVGLGETAQHLLGRSADQMMRPRRYWLYLLAAFVTEGAFAVPAAVTWHMEDQNLKAFAVGLVVCAMLHIATVRAIHLPVGLAGAAAVSLLTLGSNTLYWSWRGDYAELAVSTACALVAIGYSLGAIFVSNTLHRETVQGRSEAQAANAAKDRFLAQMSHELRTPLNAILGMGHAELRRTQDPLSRDRLSVLITSAEGLSTILDDILDMSAVQEGRLPIRPQPVSPRDQISASAELFRPSIEEAGIALTLDLAEDLPARARLDPQRLRQCLSNLLSNALKHTATGSIHILARNEWRSNGPPLLWIEVSDTGTGISPEQRETIFQPFVRNIDDDAKAPPGNGLGLSISRALARQMGGDLIVASAPGQPGARFVLTLVQEIVAAARLPAAAPKLPEPAQTDPDSLTGLRVLVVDDIATNRLVAKAYLHLLGVATLEASSGPEALQIVQSDPVDLLLLDMNMPGMDGVETFHALRALPGPRGRLPVVAMTADALEDQRTAYLAHGLDGYVSKPVTPDRIAGELRRVLAGVAA